MSAFPPAQVPHTLPPFPSQPSAKTTQSHAKATTPGTPPLLSKEDIAPLTHSQCQTLLRGLSRTSSNAKYISSYIAKCKAAAAQVKPAPAVLPDFEKFLDRLDSALGDIEEYEDDEWSYERQNEAVAEAQDAVCEATRAILAECTKSKFPEARTEALDALTEMADNIRKSVRADEFISDGVADELAGCMEQIFEMQKAHGEKRTFIDTDADFKYVVVAYERLGTSVFKFLRDKIAREDGI